MGRIIFRKQEILFLIICSICLQMPDVKIAVMKLPEIIMLLLFPYFIKDFFKHRIIVAFFLFYIFFLALTFIVNKFSFFYINQPLTFLKKPYFISISRWVEIVACLTFTVLCVKIMGTPERFKDKLRKLLFIQIHIFGVFFLFVFFLFKAHILTTFSYTNPIVYDTGLGEGVYRLKGFYVEGGPFGLFYAFIFSLSLFFYKKCGLNRLYLILPVVLVLCAHSKSGYLMILMSLGVYGIRIINRKLKSLPLRIAVYGTFFVGALVVMQFLLTSYIQSVTTLEEQSANFSPDEIDPNFMMGRISATVIVPNMVKDTWWHGIGWGNYPLTRNNPAYRDFFPEIPVSFWDAPGLGGIVDLLIDGGLLVLLSFFIIIFWFFRSFKRQQQVQPLLLMISFLGPLLLGVQLTFFYPWFAVALLILYKNLAI